MEAPPRRPWLGSSRFPRADANGLATLVADRENCDKDSSPRRVVTLEPGALHQGGEAADGMFPRNDPDNRCVSGRMSPTDTRAPAPPAPPACLGPVKASSSHDHQSERLYLEEWPEGSTLPSHLVSDVWISRIESPTEYTRGAPFAMDHASPERT